MACKVPDKTCYPSGGVESLPAAGERPNDFGFTADADDLAPVRQQHGMSGGLAQLYDGLQRKRGGHDGEAGLQVDEAGIVLHVAQRLRHSIEFEVERFIRT